MNKNRINNQIRKHLLLQNNLKYNIYIILHHNHHNKQFNLSHSTFSVKFKMFFFTHHQVQVKEMKDGLQIQQLQLQNQYKMEY